MNSDQIIKAIATEYLLKAGETYIQTMDEFSQWLVKEKYILNYLNGKWQKPRDEQRELSELYQIFLKSMEE